MDQPLLFAVGYLYPTYTNCFISNSTSFVLNKAETLFRNLSTECTVHQGMSFNIYKDEKNAKKVIFQSIYYKKNNKYTIYNNLFNRKISYLINNYKYINSQCNKLKKS